MACITTNDINGHKLSSWLFKPAAALTHCLSRQGLATTQGPFHSVARPVANATHRALQWTEAAVEGPPCVHPELLTTEPSEELGGHFVGEEGAAQVPPSCSLLAFAPDCC